MNTFFPPIRINLTNYCNQNCPFCFATQTMKSSRQKNISLDDFNRVVMLSQKANIHTAQLIGGEPTIHPEFNTILDLALKYFFSVRIFTNGILPPYLLEKIKSYKHRVGLTVNVTTPGFLLNVKIRQQIKNNIRELLPSTPIALSVVSNFLNNDYVKILNLLKDTNQRQLDMIFAFNLPEAGGQNSYVIEQFPKIGNQIVKAIKTTSRYYSFKSIDLSNSGVRPCMFTSSQNKYLKSKKIFAKTQCHNNDDWFTISFDGRLSSYRCYPLSMKDHIDIKQSSDFKKIQKDYLEIHKSLQRKFILPFCRKCPFFGYNKGRCSGPCLGFRINA